MPSNPHTIAGYAVTEAVDAALGEVVRQGGAIGNIALEARSIGIFAAHSLLDAIKRPNKCDAERIERGDWIRASGDVGCDACGFQYRDHPLVPGFDWLHRTCTGRLVKL